MSGGAASTRSEVLWTYGVSKASLSTLSWNNVVAGALLGHEHPVSPEPHDKPRWEVADIFRLFAERYAQTHAVSPFAQRVIDHLIACRTTRLGGHLDSCAQCGFERPASHSCRNRHCPTGQTVTKAKWGEARRAELLPTASLHPVLTLPHDLNALLLDNKRLLLGLLFRAASETRLQFGRQNLGGQLGAVMVWQTWDQVWKPHLHLHALVPGGALASPEPAWVPPHPKFLFPVKALGQVFHGKFLAACQEPALTQALCFNEHTAHLSTQAGFSQLIDQLYGTNGIVYAKPPCKGPEQVLDYLGRYTHRVAISNHRIVDVRGGQVHFPYRNRRQGDQLQTLELTAHALMQRFVLHLLPAGFVRMRHYGLLANRGKAHALRQCRHALGQSPAPPVPPPKSIAQWMQQWTGIDMTCCPQCGQQPLLRTPVPMAGGSPRPRAPSTARLTGDDDQNQRAAGD